MWCRWTEREITALADGQRAAWRAALVRRHLRSCSGCSARRAEVERSVALQRRLLPRVVRVSAVPTDEMLAEVHRRLQSHPEPLKVPSQMWPRLVLASAGGALVFVLALRLLNPVWIVLGFESPPHELAESPDLFRDYQLFEHLDAIENLDRVPQPGASDVDGQSDRG